MRLYDLLDAGASEHPDREFALQRGRRLTYGDAARATRRLAQGLIERGLAAGDRVAVLSRNSIDVVLLYFAAARAGVVPVPLNYRLAPPEWRYIVDDARARVLFAAGDYVDARGAQPRGGATLPRRRRAVHLRLHLPGGSLVILDQFNPAEVVRLLDEERIGFAVLVPTMLQACLAVPDAAQRRYAQLRLIYYGSSPIAEVTLRRAFAAFRCGFVQSYGMTEAAQSLTFLALADHERALAGNPSLLLAAGRPAAETEIRIVDAADALVPDGIIGEVVARGPQLMRGYWNLPEATAETLRGGWLHTGDAGVMDSQGYLYIQDRVKDMIVSGGENIYPREVEEILSKHPAVLEAAVIGIPDERWGETVKAVVALRWVGFLAFRARSSR